MHAVLEINSPGHHPLHQPYTGDTLRKYIHVAAMSTDGLIFIAASQWAQNSVQR